MSQYKINILFVAFISCFISGLYASGSDNSEYEFKNLSVKDGLSYNMVNCIYSDHKGFMWIGTYNGLNRYDSYEFDIWKHTPLDSGSLSDNHVTCILEDANHNLWVGTSNGINKFLPSSNSFQNYYPVNNRNNYVHALFIDSENNLFMGTRNGLFRFNYNDEKFDEIKLPVQSKKSLCNASPGIPHKTLYGWGVLNTGFLN